MFNPLIYKIIDGVIVVTGSMTPQRAAFYAKGNCRRCHGRGVLVFSDPSGIETVTTCRCAIRRMTQK